MMQTIMAALTCQKESHVVGDSGKAFMVISFIHYSNYLNNVLSFLARGIANVG